VYNPTPRILRGRSIKQLEDERKETAARLKELEPKIRTVTRSANKKMRPLLV